MAIKVEYASERDAQKIIGDLCNKVAVDRMRVVITDETGPKLALVPIRHGELLEEFARQFDLGIDIENEASVASKEAFTELYLSVLQTKRLVLIMQQGRPCLALVPLDGRMAQERLFGFIDIDDLLEIEQHERGCIASSEFEEAVKRVGQLPYDEIARSLEESTNDTVQRLVAKGAPTPQQFLRRVSGKRER